MYYPPYLAFYNSDKFQIVQDLVSEAYMYYPGPYYLLLNFNFNISFRGGGVGVHVLPPIWHNKQEERRIKP